MNEKWLMIRGENQEASVENMQKMCLSFQFWNNKQNCYIILNESTAGNRTGDSLRDNGTYITVSATIFGIR